MPLENLTSAEDRSRWVQQQVQYARDNFLDGVNVDIEYVVPDPLIRDITLLVQELANEFRKAFENPMVCINMLMYIQVVIFLSVATATIRK